MADISCMSFYLIMSFFPRSIFVLEQNFISTAFLVCNASCRPIHVCMSTVITLLV